MISGGFDPIHVGHIRLIREATKYGNVIVAMNSDEWIFRQNGFNSSGFKERKEVLNYLKELQINYFIKHNITSVQYTDETKNYNERIAEIEDEYITLRKLLKKNNKKLFLKKRVKQ